jgi:hypothetical protein
MSGYAQLRKKSTHAGLHGLLGLGAPELDAPDRRAKERRNTPQLYKAYYKRLNRAMMGHDKAESIVLRKGWLAAQKRANYQNEYDRIRGLLSQTILPDGAKRLEDRQAELKSLGITGLSLMV